MKKTLYGGYYVPIIVVRGKNTRFYIIDGHHRARVYLWMRTKINAFILDIPGYEPRNSYRIWEIDLINPHDPLPSWLNVWRHMVNIVHFLEKKHNVIARLWREKLLIKKLIPTEKIYYREVPSNLHEPILVYYIDNNYYVVDGHNRVCSNLLRGHEYIDAVVFTLDTMIGLIKTSKRIGLKGFNQDICSYDES